MQANTALKGLLQQRRPLYPPHLVLAEAAKPPVET